MDVVDRRVLNVGGAGRTLERNRRINRSPPVGECDAIYCKRERDDVSEVLRAERYFRVYAPYLTVEQVRI